MDKITENEREVYNCYNYIKDSNCKECSFKNECSPEKFEIVLNDANKKIDEIRKMAITKVNKMHIEELEKFIKY